MAASSASPAMVDPGASDEEQNDHVATLLLETTESEGARSFSIDENPQTVEEGTPYRPSVDFSNTPAQTMDRNGLYLQFMSDIHLEFRRVEGAPVFQPRAPLLALVGDIGNPNMKNWRQFLWRQADRFEHVFLVPGNHEYYLSAPPIAKEKMARICSKKPNLHLLDNGYFDLNDQVRVVGTTMWANPQPRHYQSLQDNMSDYTQITLAGSYIQPSHVAEWHKTSAQFLKEQRDWAIANDKQLVVLTHHAPILQALPPEQRKTWIASGYTTDMKELFGGPVILWIYGHTHIAFDKVIGGTRILSNPLGYKTQKLWEKGLFSAEKVVEIVRSEPEPAPRKTECQLL